MCCVVLCLLKSLVKVQRCVCVVLCLLKSLVKVQRCVLCCALSIIAVSYEARAHGVSRNMWADDARKLCPDLQVARVREAHGKADLTL